MFRLREDARAELMGHTILEKSFVRNVEPATIPQFANESLDDLFGCVHCRRTAF